MGLDICVWAKHVSHCFRKMKVGRELDEAGDTYD